MAVAFDAVGPSSAGAAAGAVTSLSWTHTNVGSGVALIFGGGIGWSATPTSVAAKLDPAGANTTVPQLARVSNNSGAAGDTFVFGLPNVSSGAHTIQITTTGGTVSTWVFGSMSYTGADTSAAFGTPATSAGIGSAPAVTLNPTTSGNMAAGFASEGTNDLSNPATSRWVNNVNLGGSGASCGGGADKAAGGSLTFTWSNTGSDWWGAVAVEILAAAAGGPGTPTVPYAFPQMRTEWISGHAGGRVIRT